ncbi:glycoside hydrolase family 13 protein [Rivibacter subsaxonicus]|uniref:Glycosidase n=1 Tax=Rivibacter subsaxonicus TaxID=457575 RepID=A0A4Q7VYX9_9BURK|nr:glycoside hydrolase family 13 protein [Rivibacter subsaxonicus]RZU01994.1 glycosidase [Rivibacter subsaxonicus]
MKPTANRALPAVAALLLSACAVNAPAPRQAPVAPVKPDPGCLPAPLAGRDLYLRGAFNNWAATENERFAWVCDHHELLAALKGEHPFKLADEDWSDDADFGAGPGPDRRLEPGRARTLVPKGTAVEAAFEGQQRFVLRWPAGAAPQLALEALPAGSLDVEAWRRRHAVAATSVDDPVALGLRFDSRDAAHKAPFGAITAGTEARFALAAPAGVQRATLVVEKRRLEGNQEVLEYREVARVPMELRDGRWRATHRFAEPAVYGYWFEIEVNGRRYAYQNNRDAIYWTREKGSGGLGLVEPLPEQLKRIRRFRQTVYAADYQVPAYAPDLVYYYVFPDRFRDGDPRNNPRPGARGYQDKPIELHANWLEKPFKPGSGDGSDAIYNNDFFGGDIQGLIDKLDHIADLGANALYITPMFTAASNHKYDTADYRSIDPAFGSNADFQRLTQEAAKRGIRVIPDTSLNHTGIDSIYFDRFGKYPGIGAFEAGRIRADSPWASWYRFDPMQADPARQYRGWVGVADLPELDKSSKDFRAFAYGEGGVTQQWLELGAAGWRMDVAPWVPDDFWREWRAAVKRAKPDAITIAETWFDASKHFLGDAFDSTMNYIFRNTVLDYAAGGDARKLYPNIELMREQYPKQSFYALMNLVSSHDQARALHVLGATDERDAAALELAKRRLRLATLFQAIFPGSPAIYYGDEVGVGGGDDPYNRATYPWPDRGGRPDLALEADVKRLLAMRKAHPVLRHGSLDAPLLLDEHLIVLAREQAGAFAISATNNAGNARTASVRLPPAMAGRSFVDVLSGAVVQAEGQTLSFSVPPLFGRVLIAR